MSDAKPMRLNEALVESTEFGTRWEGLVGAAPDSAAYRALHDEIAQRLQDWCRQGRFIPPGEPDRRSFAALVEHWSWRLAQRDQTSTLASRLDNFDPEAGVVLSGPCPYPGLEPYHADRQDSFFGRDALIDDSVAHLGRPGNRVLMLVGASGSGKSSLLLAGVLPRLSAAAAAPPALLAPPMLPGEHPMAALAAALSAATSQPERRDEILASLDAEPQRAWQAAAGWCGNRTLVLVVDQFEELLTLCRDGAEQQRFATALCALGDPSAAAEGFRCLLLLTLRTDHLAKLEQTPALQPLHALLSAEGNYRYVGSIGIDEIRQAIQVPADRVGLRFIPRSLVDRLAEETAVLGNGLPLLQFTLQRLWDMRRLDMVTEAEVDTLSGLTEAERAAGVSRPVVAAALGTVAAREFERFSAPRRKVCERLMLELVVLDETFEEPLRRRRDEDELRLAVASESDDPADFDHVIETFVAAHLLRRFPRGGGRSLVEVTHEALLRRWDHMARKLGEDAVKTRLHLVKQIQREAEDWKREPARVDLLKLRGEALRQALEHRQSRWITEPVPVEYVEACQRLAAAEQSAASRSRRLRQGLTAVAVVLFAIALWAGFAAIDRDRDLDNALAPELATRAQEVDAAEPRLKLLLGVESLARRASHDAVEAVRTALDAPEMRVLGSERLGSVDDAVVLQISPDDRLVAVGRANGEVLLFEPPPTGEGAWPPAVQSLHHGARVAQLAFSGDGSRLAVASSDGLVSIWRMSDRKRSDPTHPLPPGAGLSALALSHSGRRLATVQRSGQGQIVDLASHKVVSGFQVGDPLAALSFAGTKEDTLRVVEGSGCDAVLRTFGTVEAAAPEKPRVCGPADAAPLSYALSSNANRIAKSDRAGLYLHTVGSDARLPMEGAGSSAGAAGAAGAFWDKLRTGRTTVVALAFSSAGRYLATLSADRREAVVLDGGGQMRARIVSDEALQDVTVSDHGRFVVAIEAGKVRRWAISDRVTESTIQHFAGYPVAAAPVQPSASASKSAASRYPVPLEGVQTPIASYHGSNDIRLVLSALPGDTELRVWDAAQPYARLRSAVEFGRIDSPGLLASPSGRVVGVLARAGDPASTPRLESWTVAPDGTLKEHCARELPGGKQVTKVQLADGRRTIAAILESEAAVDAAAAPPMPMAKAGGEVVVWQPDASTAGAPCRLVARTFTGAQQVALSPDGRWLAFAGSDDTNPVTLWDLDHGTALGTDVPLRRPHQAPITALAFSADSRVLASGASDGSIQLWVRRGDRRLTTAGAPLQGGHGLATLAFGPDVELGTYRLACGHERGICLKHLALRTDGEAARLEVRLELARAVELEPGSVPESIVFSPDSRLLAALGAKGLRIWNVADGAQAFRRTGPDNPAQRMRQVVFIGRSRIEAITSDGVGTILELDVARYVNEVLSFLKLRPDLALTRKEWKDWADPSGRHAPRLVRLVDPPPPVSDTRKPLDKKALQSERVRKVMQMLQAHAVDARAIGAASALPAGQVGAARWAELAALTRELPAAFGSADGRSAPDQDKARALADELGGLLDDIERAERSGDDEAARAASRRWNLCTRCAGCHDVGKTALGCSP